MNQQARAIQLSIGLHLVLLLCAMGLGQQAAQPRKPLVIDFTMQAPGAPQVQMRQGSPEARQGPSAIIKPVAPSAPVRPAETVSKSVPPVSAIPETQQVLPVSPPSAASSAAVSSGPAAVSHQPVQAGHANSGARTEASASGQGHAGSGASSGVTEKARYLKEHFSYIKDIVQKNVSYPGIARKMGWEGKVVVAFTILSDGNTKDVQVSEGCGVELLNKNALEAVKKAVPFPKPPVEAQVIIPIVYRLN